MSLSRFRSLCALGLGLLLCTVLLQQQAQARAREIPPGKPVELAADEGLLVVAVDTNAPLGLLRIVPLRGTGAIRDANPFEKGSTYRLYAVDAGRFRWFETQRKDLRVEVRLSMAREEFSFDVKPGVINYPGDFIFRGDGIWFGRVHIANRGLPVLDWLRQAHPGLLQRYGLGYTGRYPDPFPAWYARVVSSPGADAKSVTLPPPPVEASPLPIAELWKESSLELVELSPDGRLLGEVQTFRKDDKTYWGVNLIDLEAETSVRLFEAPKPIWRLDWVTERDLVMSIGRDDEPDVVLVVNVTDGEAGRKYGLVVVPRLGVLVSTLRDEPGHILFSSRSESASGGMMVHKLDVRSQKALKEHKFRWRDRLDRGVYDARTWFADASGHLRMAIAVNKDGKRVLMHGAGEEFREILDLEDPANDFAPLMLSADGSKIYGLAEEGRSQRDLVEFDVAQGKVVRTVFSQPGVDVISPLRDVHGDLVGASYYRDGLLFSHYFDDRNTALAERLRKAFPDRAATIMQRDRNERHFLVAVGGSDMPTAVYHFDAQASRAALISETRPWLSKYRFAPTRTVSAKSRDGFEIEAYLTLPEARGTKLPLVVFPHGGPIGVRDSRYFDPDVQFLAAQGYAVLQVNFRGSEGFGTAFREAASGQYGAAIEDDIDAALKAVLADFPLDGQRMCMLGASYGGYSSLVSAIRWPGRFRCAVSISGLSDLPLFFTASDSARRAEVRMEMEKKIGNPNTDLPRMQRDSPLYRYRELALPVMLVHGTEDARVDYEHARRMVRLLNLAGRPPVLVELEGAGRSVEGYRSRF